MKKVLCFIITVSIFLSIGTAAFAQSQYKHYSVKKSDNDGVWYLNSENDEDFHFTFDGPTDTYHNVSLFCDDKRMKNYGEDWSLVEWGEYIFTVSSDFMEELGEGTHHFTVYYCNDNNSRGGFDMEIKPYSEQ